MISCCEGGRISKNFLGSWKSYDWICSSKHWIYFSILSTINSQNLVLKQGKFGDFNQWSKALKTSSSNSVSANSFLISSTTSHRAGFATYPTIAWVNQQALEYLDRFGVARWMVQPAYVSDCCPPSASDLQFDFMYWDKTINKSNVLPSMVTNMLALEFGLRLKNEKSKATSNHLAS